MEKAAAGNKRIKPVYLDANMGFAGGNNAAIAQSTGKYVLLANPDSESIPPAKHGLTKDFVEIFYDRAASDPSIGIMGMKLNQRDDVLPGLTFPYFGCAFVTRECLDACKISDGKWLDEAFWPAYYEDACLTLRAIGKGFKVVEQDVPFWHKSGGTNKYAIEGGKDGPYVPELRKALDKLSAEKPDMADWGRKRAELESGGMQALISGNMRYLDSKYGAEARSKVKVVWNTHIGAAVGFSVIAEGLSKALHEMGFDVYVNDWSNGSKITDPLVRQLYEKTVKAKADGEDLADAINIVCWLMETFMDVDADYKVGISFCESTKVRESYLQACNSCDRILTFSNFCKRVQLDSGFKPPIHVLPPGVPEKYIRLIERPERKKFTFLAVGVSQDRKDTRRLVDAFCEAFPRGASRPPECEEGFPIKCDDIELVVKSNNFGDLKWIEQQGFAARANVRGIFTGWDQRAERPDFSEDEMLDLYASADCLVHPSHGEGIGYPLLEMAATGGPVIFTNWSSPAEYFDESNSYPISLSPYPGTTLTPAYGGAPGDNGLWANCFAPGTPVRTADGMRHIEEVNVGDLVLTHKGRYRRVINKNAREYSGQVVVINGMLNNHKIVVTPEHPFLCVKTSKCYAPDFVNAKDLSAGDALLLPFINDERKMERIDVAEFAGENAFHDDDFVWMNPTNNKKRGPSIKDVAAKSGTTNSVAQRVLSNIGCFSKSVASAVRSAARNLKYEKGKPKKIRRFLEIDEKFGRLCGFYLAEGCSSGHSVVFAFHVKEQEYMDEVLSLMLEKFGVIGRQCKIGGNGAHVIFCSTIVARTFRGLFGHGARNKAMPVEWAFLSKDVARGIAYGLWHGDGCREKAFSYKTSSPRLAYQMNAMLLKLGIAASVLTNNIGQYLVKIGDADNTARASKIFEHEDVARKHAKYMKWSDEEYSYLPIHEIKTKQYAGMVYNLEVEEDNTYCVASAATHNCHIGHLKFLMYHVIRNQDEAREKGRLAHEKVKSTYRWSETARQMFPLLLEWDAERRKKEARGVFDPMTWVKPKLDPVRKGDRCMIDVVTRDRHPYLGVLLGSLLNQTFKEWDIIVEIDDTDESVLRNHLIMSLMHRFHHEGHGWSVIRSHRQGPHVAHDRTLRMTAERPHKYKLVCRVDDDLVLRPDYLEHMYGMFLEDKGCNIAAVSGVLPDPNRPESEQTAPASYEHDVNYAGMIDHNVPWPYVCFYPPGTKPRPVEHLYSSFMYRLELGMAIGGYCRLFSQIGHREESDFSYRFHLAGYRQYVQPKSVGFHFQAPAGGIRSMDIAEKQRLAEGDHRIYTRRIGRWRKQAKLRAEKDAEGAREVKVNVNLPGALEFGQAVDHPVFQELATQKSTNKMVVVINGSSIEASEQAVGRFSQYGDVYVTCEAAGAKERLSGHPSVKMVASTADESVSLTRAILSEGDHDFVMTVKDTTVMLGNPVPLLSDEHDDYVFESYVTYKAPHEARPDEAFIGPEASNECLIYRRGGNKTSGATPMERILYSDIIALDKQDMQPASGKSAYGNDLVRLSQVDKSSWTKICLYQHPEGTLNPPRKLDMVPDRQDLVSIIIPTAGRLPLLRKCVDSIFSFTSTPFEVIIVDNASMDGTAEYLEQEAARRGHITVIRQPVNLGYQKAINLGVAKSKGSHVLLFNDDAWVEARDPDGRDWLRILMEELESSPKVGIVGPHGGESPALGKRILYFWCVMLRRSLWDEVGGLDDVTFTNYGGDDDYCERLRSAGYEIRERNVRLRHLMTCVPDDVKRPELEESVRRLRAKYGK
jgi:GT2 family glycosyltransferase/intein/homing endonuclease